MDHFHAAGNHQRDQVRCRRDPLLHLRLLALLQYRLQCIDLQYVIPFRLFLSDMVANLLIAFLVELFPYSQRSRGISIFQFWGRGAAFFTTFVNPIGLKNISWKWLITYCCWLAFEIVFVYFMFPETYGRTLEELAFLFEDQALADEATAAVEKQIHHGHGPSRSPVEKEAPVQTKELV